MGEGGSGGGDGEGEGGGYVPTGSWMKVSHYYGDIARQLMLGSAALMFFAAPFYGDNTHIELPFIIFGTLVLVFLAALTNPWKKSVLTADAIATGVGLVVYQWWALYGYDTATSMAFVLREALAVAFMFAFYFSVKTVRSMILHQVGKRDSVDEFAGVTEDDERDKLPERMDKFGD